MTDICKTCRWPIRLHAMVLGNCPVGVPQDATVDEFEIVNNWLMSSTLRLASALIELRKERDELRALAKRLTDRISQELLRADVAATTHPDRVLVQNAIESWVPEFAEAKRLGVI